MNKTIAIFFLHLLFLFGLGDFSRAGAQTPNSTQIPPLPADVPQIGAEVWVTPDTTPDQMDMWMKLLADHHMPYARIWLDEWNLKNASGAWDFTLYDAVFAAAQRHGVKVMATFTPATQFPAGTPDELEHLRKFVTAMVQHYKDNPALETWILINEPGKEYSSIPLVTQRWAPWLRDKYKDINVLNKAWGTRYKDFSGDMIFGGDAHDADLQLFWSKWYADQIIGLADMVRQIDTAHQLHVNPDEVIENLARKGDDFPAWRPALTIFGASLHPAWHFMDFMRRDQYALGVAYISDVIKGSAEPLPFWITELQGGNNIYSGRRPLYPDAKDIAQWLWVSFGTGSRRDVFWLLNTRPAGNEAGEWSLLDFQNRPSERLLAAEQVEQTMQAHADFFRDARPLETPVTLMLSMHTMILELKRGYKEHLKEVLGFFENFNELGMPVRVKWIDDFDWSARTDTPQFVVLPDVASLDADECQNIKSFVKNGNTVLATGLTGFYDDHDALWVLKGFPLQETFGGNFKEVRFLGDKPTMDLNELQQPAQWRANARHFDNGPRDNPVLNLTDPQSTLPISLFCGDIDNIGGKVIARDQDRILATTHQAGSGKVIWIPSFIGTGSWYGDHAPLASALKQFLSDSHVKPPFSFASPAPGVVMGILVNNGAYATILTNGSDTPTDCLLQTPADLKPTVIWGAKESLSLTGAVHLEGRDTVVILWNP